jgi:hypothetical protein
VVIARPCPVCKTGQIRARTAHALYRRACCSRSCALSIAREVRANPPAHVVAARARLAELVTRAAKAAANAPLKRGQYLRTIAEHGQSELRRRAAIPHVIDASARIVHDLEGA